MITINPEHINCAPGDRILDMGCGEGRHIAAVCSRKGVKCTGSDKSFQNLLETREKLETHKRMNEFRAEAAGLAGSDIRDLPFQTEIFDTVICSEVLEHIDQDEKAVKELVRVLKPGKILAVSVPGFLPERLCWLLSKEYSSASQGHIRIYRKDRLTEMIERAGARHVKTHYAHSLHSPFWWIKCIVGCNRKDSRLVELYHKFLVWDLMKKPRWTGTIERILNPVLGKSLVLYFIKDA
ncbi:MAG: class I SAM-dependent methyltransferase [Desulfobacteraceae bacterium]